MPEEPKRYQCRHIFTDGRRCGSPSLRHEELCYYHHTTRRPVDAPAARHTHFDLPLPEDRSAIQSAIGQVLQRIARNEIDPKRAGLLLYGLQIASLNLPREAAPSRESSREDEPDLVEEVVADPIYGPLAPRAELGKTKHQSVIQALLDNLRDDPPGPPEGWSEAKRWNETEEWNETEGWSETKEWSEATEPGAPQPALSLPKGPAFEDLGESPQPSNPASEILPQIQARATSIRRRIFQRRSPRIPDSGKPRKNTAAPTTRITGKNSSVYRGSELSSVSSRAQRKTTNPTIAHAKARWPSHPRRRHSHHPTPPSKK